jgi:RNA polymerase sigma factor (sigma-70 family)
MSTAATPDPMEHQKLVYWVARKFAGKGLDLSDLIAEAQVALANACRCFDPGRGIKFSTYATTAMVRQLIIATGRQHEWVHNRVDLPDNLATASRDEPKARRDILRLLDGLPETWATVLRLRFGIDREPLTGREVASMIGRSHSRVGQIEQQALKRLRAMAVAG